MKQFNVFRGLILTILLTCCNSVWAYDIEVDGIYYNITSTTDLTVEVTEGDNKYSGDIVIPSTITYKSKTFTVTGIGEQAFYFNNLTSVVIPNSVTTIGGCAFYYCTVLTSVEIPNSVTTIGGSAFSSCWSLTSITLPNSVTTIGSSAFQDCSSLTSINIPDSVTSIEKNAFYRCSSLTSVVIPNGVTNIGKYAFYGCSSLTSVVIPNTVTFIDYDAFDGCKNISEVHINSLTAWCNIEFSTFSSNPLYYAKNLYLNGELVTELIIPDDVTKINDCAFYCCESITSVVIPSSVTSIGLGAFLYCKALEYIYVMTETPPSVKNNTFTNKNYIDVVLYVPTGCLEAYQNADVWKEFWEIKEFDTTGISDVKTENKKETTIYDINGRVVENPTNGIYIVDGKKVLLR